MSDAQEKGKPEELKKKDTDTIEKSESKGIMKTDTGEKEPEEEKVEEETLYKALKNIGISNITTLVDRLGLVPKGKIKQEPAQTKGDPKNYKPESKSNRRPNVTYEEIEMEKKHGSVQENAKALLRLMRLDPNSDNVLLLEKISLQGREMLGELSKATITSTPIKTTVQKPTEGTTGKE